MPGPNLLIRPSLQLPPTQVTPDLLAFAQQQQASPVAAMAAPRPQAPLAPPLPPTQVTPELAAFAQGQMQQRPEANGTMSHGSMMRPQGGVSLDSAAQAFTQARDAGGVLIGYRADGSPVYGGADQAIGTRSPAGPSPSLLLRPRGNRPAQTQAQQGSAGDAPGQPPNIVDELTQQGSGIGEPRRSGLDTARQSLALDQRFANQRAQDGAIAGEMMGDAEREYQRSLQRQEAEREQAMGRARDAVNRAAQRAASMSVDPNRASRGAGGVLNAIAVGLGTFGAAMGGGPNSALQIVTDRINQDIEAQRTDIDQANNNVSTQRGMLADVRDEFQSRDAAIAATRAAMLRQAAAEAEVQARQTDSAEVQARAQNLRDQLEEQAQAAAAEAQRAEAEAMLTMADREAQLRRHQAQATLAEAQAQRLLLRGQGGAAPPRARPVTEAQVNTMTALMGAGVGREEAARQAGLPLELVPQIQQAGIGGEQRGTLDSLDSSLRILEDAIATSEAEGSGISGVGTFDRALAGTPVLNALQTADAATVRREIENTTDLIGRLRSGGAISSDEEARFRRLVEGNGTEAEFRINIQRLRAELDARLGRGARSGATSDATQRMLLGLGARPASE